MRLTGKTALVTGGGSGIGEATAAALAQEGCRVAICGRRKDVLDETVKRHAVKPPLRAFAADVSERKDVEALFAWAAKELGRIDILVNAAGINIPKRMISELSPENWDLLLKVNATGAFHCVQAVLPQMKERQDGVIVNIGSISGKRATPLGGVGYNASKFAMTALGISVGEEMKDLGIRVTNIYPGEVDTPILRHRPAPTSPEHRARMLKAEDVAAAVLMVACLSPRACVRELVITPTKQGYV
ncbi:MAG: SDR family oxidoreductase [Planctomycetes bacterium]|nr:SDR family oxidoreductase [Planctomycetota bacterium]